MTITALPTPPSRSDSANFATRGDAFLAALPTFATEANALQVDVNAKYNELASAYQSAANIAIAANTATSQAAAAVVAKDAAVAAWAASTSPAETLASISKSLHYGAVVKAIIYDTSKDSDGGAWRKRCADKSWYTESLGFTGTWGGQAASNAAGWAACGSVVGGAYQSTADGKFYTPLSSSTQTEIFRGNVREFPEQVAIVAESGRVVIYDLTQAGTPMWRSFPLPNGGAGMWGGGTATSVAAGNGQILIAGSQRLIRIKLISDAVYQHHTSAGGAIRFVAPVASFATATASYATTEYGLVVSNAHNDVALTVLDSAPIDAATGLPTPTIAVATAGGISVIKDDGTVVNSSNTSAFVKVGIDERFELWGLDSANQNISRYGEIGSRGASFSGVKSYSSSTTPAMLGIPSSIGSPRHIGSTLGLTLLKDNPATQTAALIARITNAYNSGWQVGDSRGAHLSDTVAETITAGGELVSNGDFPTNTTGWTAGSGATLSVASGQLNITNDGTGTNAGTASQLLTLVVGKTYQIYAENPGAATLVLGYSLSVGSTGAGSINISAGASGILNIVPTATATYITVKAGVTTASAVSKADNISCKLAEPDRSVKNKGLTLVGSLTKAAVASGAGLVAYSGFSAANYLEQPYNSDLDFGTGDFCVMGWVNLTTVASQILCDRGTAGGATFNVYITGASWAFTCSATEVGTVTSSTATGGLHFVVLYRASGTIYMNVDGVGIHSVANTANITNASAKLNLGVGNAHTSPVLGSLSLWRISATAPSADQIAHIYRTELPLFQAGAQCTIAGSYAGVTALAYDDVADTLHVGTTYGRSGFRDLSRIDSEATTVGAVTSLSANQGAVLTGGAASGRYYQPALLLRDELRRKDEARRALGKVPVFFDFDAVTSQVAFVLPKGYTTKAVYSAGTLKRLGAAKDYTTNTDGFQETVTFAVAPGNTVWVSVMAVRS